MLESFCFQWNRAAGHLAGEDNLRRLDAVRATLYRIGPPLQQLLLLWGRGGKPLVRPAEVLSERSSSNPLGHNISAIDSSHSVRAELSQLASALLCVLRVEEGDLLRPHINILGNVQDVAHRFHFWCWSLFVRLFHIEVRLLPSLSGWMLV